MSSCITPIDLVRAILPQVAGKTSITMDEFVAIEGVTRQMFETLNARERGTQHMPAAELAEGDADENAPSLYAARRGFYRTSSSASEPGPSEPAKPEAPEPVTPVTPMDPIPGGGPRPFTTWDR